MIPEKMDLKAMIRFAPEGVVRPRWLLDFLRHGGHARPHLPEPGPGRREPAPTFFGAYYEWMTTPLPTWEDVAWLREQWDGPFVIKGIQHPDDARRAVDAGATAISVSNHGGNNLDGTPGVDPGAPGRGGRGRRAARGAARRRHPAGQRRGQGARARAPGRS